MYYDLEKQYLKILESIKKCGGFPSRYSELDIDLAYDKCPVCGQLLEWEE